MIHCSHWSDWHSHPETSISSHAMFNQCRWKKKCAIENNYIFLNLSSCKQSLSLILVSKQDLYGGPPQSILTQCNISKPQVHIPPNCIYQLHSIKDSEMWSLQWEDPVVSLLYVIVDTCRRRAFEYKCSIKISDQCGEATLGSNRNGDFWGFDCIRIPLASLDLKLYGVPKNAIW